MNRVDSTSVDARVTAFSESIGTWKRFIAPVQTSQEEASLDHLRKRRRIMEKKNPCLPYGKLPGPETCSAPCTYIVAKL